MRRKPSKKTREREAQLAQLARHKRQHEERSNLLALLRSVCPNPMQGADGMRRYRLFCRTCSLPSFVETCTDTDGFEAICYSACPFCGVTSWGSWRITF